MQQIHKKAANHRSIGDLTHQPHMLRFGDAEADADRLVSQRPDSRNESLHIGWNLVLRTRDARA